jgi:hypothetical protein
MIGVRVRACGRVTDVSAQRRCLYDEGVARQSLAIADTISGMTDTDEVAGAIRQVAQGLIALADAVAGVVEQPAEPVRALELLSEWGERGLTRAEASALFRKHGFAPQTAGGWSRSDWIEIREDGHRYITDSSRRWVAEQQIQSDG